jgi:kinetochore protein Mis12/MTW1
LYVFLCMPLQQNYLKRLLTKAARTSRRHAKQAQTRLDRLSFVQPDRLRALHDLATDVDALYAGVSALPPIDPTNADTPGLVEPGKRQWEVGKAGYLNWASAQLIQHAGLSGDASAEEAFTATSKEEMAAALRGLERDD